MPNILIIEDEEKIARFIELELEHEGYRVDKAFDGREGCSKALSGAYDLILLDILLPQLNGMEVLRRIRRNLSTPVIMLTARDAVMDKVAGIDAGADYYITKPFAIEELLAYIRAALKRSALPKTPSQADTIYETGELRLNEERHEVYAGTTRISLTSTEFDVLLSLMKHKGIVMSRERLATEALGYDYLGETNSIDVHIAHIRAKLQDACSQRLIETVRGVGYVIRDT